MTEVLQLLSSIALILGLIVACIWLLKNFSQHRLGQSELLRIRALTSVGQRERVVLLEVAGQWLVLGVASGQVTHLLTLPAPPAASALGIGATAGLASSWLDKFINKRHER